VLQCLLNFNTYNQTGPYKQQMVVLLALL
jgi:hypothetical protein